MDKKKPLCKEGVLSRQVGEEWMLYDSTQETVHVINKTAEFVWRLCDGSHSVSEIRQKMQDNFDVLDERKIKEDIEDILKKFSDLGVLTFIGE